LNVVVGGAPRGSGDSQGKAEVAGSTPAGGSIPRSARHFDVDFLNELDDFCKQYKNQDQAELRGREFELAIICALRKLGSANPARVAAELGLPAKRVKDKMRYMVRKGRLRYRNGAYSIGNPEPLPFQYHKNSSMEKALELLRERGVVGRKDVPGRGAALWRLWRKGLVVKSRTKPVIYAIDRGHLVRAILDRTGAHDVLAKIQTRPVAAVELPIAERRKAEILAKEGIVFRTKVEGMWVYHMGAPAWQLQLAAMRARNFVLQRNDRGRRTEAEIVRRLKQHFRIKRIEDFDAVAILPLGLHVLFEIKHMKRLRLTDVEEFLTKAEKFDPYALKVLIVKDTYVPKTVRDFCVKNKIKILEWDN